MTAPQTSVEARAELVKALEADLVGPYNPDTGDELLELPPSRYYLTGFLAPEQNRVASEDVQNTDMEGDQTGKNADGTETEDGRTEPPRRFWPASLGLTLLVPAGTQAVTATVRYGQYIATPASEALGKPPPKKSKTGKKRREKLYWRRERRKFENVSLPLPPDEELFEHELEDSEGVRLVVRAAALDGVPGVEKGARAVSVFVVNGRFLPSELTTEEKRRRDEKSIFQVELTVRTPHGVLARPDHSTLEGDRDDKILDLQYRNNVEYAVGHGVASDPLWENGRVVGARTAWLPQAEVVKVEPAPIKDLETRMEALAELSPEGVDEALGSLMTEYERWIAAQATKSDRMDENRREMRDDLVEVARQAKGRIAAGVELLKSDADVLTAFRLTNAAMAKSARRENPSWYPFQLAFLLLNLRGIARPEDAGERELVELIFFPTGGGKTEAYLGVIAFTLLLRRINGRARPDKGLGVAVILRYTLRLLTLDQYERAARLICTLEQLRHEKPERLELLGRTRFALGLWVGRSATPNRVKEFEEQFEDYRLDRGELPFPLAHCPVCDHALDANSFSVDDGRVNVRCRNSACEFSHGEGLPLLFVDETIYRELPAFVIGTVDKFAMLPHRAEIGALFGKRVVGRMDGVFLNPQSKIKRGVGYQRLPGGLRPPELIVQDELHLISGPLGTMVGLYETALEALCTDERDGQKIRPKILAATATVRRSSAQIQALFGRASKTRLFPPPGPDAWDTFFARVSEQANKRMYVGVAAAGRPMKRILISVYLTLLAAAQHQYPIPIHETKRRKQDGKEPEQTEEDLERERLRALSKRDQPSADPYATLVGYFNSLRELGGMRRLVEDEIYGRLRKIEERRPRDADNPHRWLKNRRILSEPVELTSREKTHTIKDSKKQLENPIVSEKRVDVCLASNMISVGVDIDRLGLMVIAGQPKSTSEYIQCSSRVGRDHNRPGLVVTAYNLAKPRDRSHYEHFGAYHEGFYRYVESQSLTPFSEPALDRGLVGALVGLIRHSADTLCPAKGAMQIGEELKKDDRGVAGAAVRALEERAATHGVADGPIAEIVRQRADHLVDQWRDQISDATADWSYSRFDKQKGGKKLLYPKGEARDQDEASDFGAPTSMRDVESAVHLWMFRSKSKSDDPEAGGPTASAASSDATKKES